MWVHVGAMTTTESCELAEHGATHGAVGVSTLPPLFYVTHLERVVEHMTASRPRRNFPSLTTMCHTSPSSSLRQTNRFSGPGLPPSGKAEEQASW